MTPVMQTETELGRGNCVAACVASVLDLPPETVPNFRLNDDPWKAMQEWLATRGLFAIRVPLDVYLYPMPKTHCIMTGDSPRSPVYHAVVGEWGGDGPKMVHDPHPDGTGLAGPAKWVTFFGRLM